MTYAPPTVRVVLLGDAGVGKSSILARLLSDSYGHQIPTIGASFGIYKTETPSGPLTLEIWDTAGAERYKSLAKMYYRYAGAAILVYDKTKRSTLEGAAHWFRELKSCADVPVIGLVGNKDDLVDETEISTEEGKEFSSSEGMSFYETSAKTGHNVLNLFQHIAHTLPDVHRGTGIPLDPHMDQPPSNCQCM